MAKDVASVTALVRASVADMGNFSAGGTSAMEDGKALLRFSRAFCDLVECLLTGLEEFRGLAAVTETQSDTAGGAELPQSSASIEVPTLELLYTVAATFQRLVEALVSVIRDNVGVQVLMPAIQAVSAEAHQASLLELMNVGEPQQPSTGNVNTPPREETLGSIYIEDSGTASRASAGDGSVAEVADFSSESTLVEQDGLAALLSFFSQCFYSLAETLLASLEEFRGAERTLELEAAGGHSPDPLSQTRVSGAEARPGPLRTVVGKLKEMDEALVLAIKGDADVQRLMPAISAMQMISAPNHHPFFEDWMSTPEHQQSGSDDSILTAYPAILAEIFSRDARMAQRSAGTGRVTREPSSEAHHPRVLDPCLWGDTARNLEELVVFARLPLPRIVWNVECDEDWHTMLKFSSAFRSACSDAHRTKLVGLLGRTVGYETMWTTLYDTESKEWLSVELTGLPGTVPDCRWEPQPEDDLDHAYISSMSASDGGLVCFVPHEHLTSSPILVCNPLTSIWKALPLPTHVVDFENRVVDLVQLVVEDATKSYRVILVSHEETEGAIWTAHFYSSGTETWSTMDFGLVYGNGFRFGVGTSTPFLFDCRTKSRLPCTGSVEDTSSDLSWARDHLFELRTDVGFVRVISEHVWSSRSSRLECVKDLDDSPVPPLPDPCGTLLFPSSNFVMIIADNFMNWLEDHRQYIGLYDRARDQWEVLPPLPRRRNYRYEQLPMSLMVDLRWDIDP